MPKTDCSSLTPLHEYDLFALHPIQLTVERDSCTEYRPISSLSNSTAPINFEINTGSEEYIQFKETELYLRVRIDLQIKGKAKTQLTSEDWKTLSPVNNLLHSMIKQVTVSVGNSEITSSNNTYSYTSYVDRLLYEGKNAKETSLASALWYIDSPGQMDLPHQGRQAWVTNKDPTDLTKGQEFELIDKLALDISNQDRAILGGSKLNITILMNDPKFYLLCAENLKPIVHILEAVLYVHKSKVNPKVVEAHNFALKNTNAKYPINRKEVKSFNVAQGVLDYHINDVYNIVLPRRVYIFCVSHEAFNGSFKKNPFNFHHYNIREICCYFNGMQYPLKPYQPDFENKKYIREYHGLFEAANQTIGETAISIKRFDYGNGFTIFGFNFAPDLSDGSDVCGYISPQTYGNLRIEIKFNNALEETINVLVFSEFDSLIEINQERKGIKNF